MVTVLVKVTISVPDSNSDPIRTVSKYLYETVSGPGIAPQDRYPVSGLDKIVVDNALSLQLSVPTGTVLTNLDWSQFLPRCSRGAGTVSWLCCCCCCCWLLYCQGAGGKLAAAAKLTAAAANRGVAMNASSAAASGVATLTPPVRFGSRARCFT